MNPFAVIAFTAGVILIWAAAKDEDPRNILRKALNLKPLPPEQFGPVVPGSPADPNVQPLKPVTRNPGQTIVST